MEPGDREQKGRTDLESTDDMLGCDRFLRVLLTNLVRLGRNEMYEF